MAKTGTLVSERLDLRPFDESFLTERYVSWLNDPVTVRYSEQRHHVHTLATCRAYAASFTDSPNYFWAIVAHDTALGHIGNISARVDTANCVSDLAIIVGDTAVRGHRYGLEAWERACRFLLEEAGMRKITAGTMAINYPMLRIMRKCNMIEEGRRRAQFLVDGAEVDAVQVALFAALS